MIVGRRLTLDGRGRLKGASAKTYRYPKGLVAPLVTDPETERFRRKWIGRRVFPYGGRTLSAQKGPDVYFDLTASPIDGMTVVDLVRVRQPGKEITYRNGGSASAEIRTNDFWLVRCRPGWRDGIYAAGGDAPLAKGFPNPTTLVWTTEFVNA